MGVRGLYTYVDKLYKQHNLEHKVVNIVDEITNFRKTNKHKPNIIIDLWTMAHNMKISTKDIVVGYRMNVIRNQFEEFLERLKKAGANLIFTFEKTQVFNKDFNETEEENYENGCVVKAEATGNHKNASRALEVRLERDWDFDIPLNQAVMLALSQVAQKFGEMVGMSSIHYELASFNIYTANKRKALAILSLNTHYLFYEAEWQFWSDADLDMEAMTVRQYNRLEVLKLLAFPQERASLFIALSETFRTSRTSNLKGGHISAEKLVDFVRHHHYPLSPKELSKAVYTKFGCSPSALQTYVDRAERRFRETHNFGPRGNFATTEQFKEFAGIMKIIKNDFANYAEEILVNSEIYISPVYFDLSVKEHSLKTKILPFLEKTCGVLLKNGKDREKRKIKGKINSDDIVSVNVDPKFPNFEVLFPYELLSGEMEENDKWKLLLWITGLKLTVTELNAGDVPLKHLHDIIVCLYLVKTGIMKLPEAQCLLLSIIQAHETEPTTDYPEEIQSRAFYLSVWYQKVFLILHSCLGAVGLKCFQGEIMFDGARFQKIYLESKAENASSRRIIEDNEILNKLVFVIKNKALGNFRPRTTSETTESSRILSESQRNQNNVNSRNTRNPFPSRIENNYEEIGSVNPRSTRREQRGNIPI